MPVSMLALMGGLLALAAALAALCFAAFHWNVLGVLFTLAALALAAALCWFAWMRRQFAFGDGGVMEQVHQTVLSHLDFDGKGQILDKTTPRLIQFHTLKNAVNPPFLGGFLFSGTVAA